MALSRGESFESAFSDGGAMEEENDEGDHAPLDTPAQCADFLASLTLQGMPDKEQQKMVHMVTFSNAVEGCPDAVKEFHNTARRLTIALIKKPSKNDEERIFQFLLKKYGGKEEEFAIYAEGVLGTMNFIRVEIQKPHPERFDKHQQFLGEDVEEVEVTFPAQTQAWDSDDCDGASDGGKEEEKPEPEDPEEEEYAPKPSKSRKLKAGDSVAAGAKGGEETEGGEEAEATVEGMDAFLEEQRKAENEKEKAEAKVTTIQRETNRLIDAVDDLGGKFEIKQRWGQILNDLKEGKHDDAFVLEATALPEDATPDDILEHAKKFMQNNAAFFKMTKALDFLVHFKVGAANVACLHRIRKYRLSQSRSDRKKKEKKDPFIERLNKITGAGQDATFLTQANGVFKACLEAPVLLLGVLSRYQLVRNWEGIKATMEKNPTVYGEYLEKISWKNPIWRDFITPFRLSVGLCSE